MKGNLMQAQVTPRRGGAAFIWKWGAIYGVILGVIQILVSLFAPGIAKTIIDVIIWLVGFFLIGMFAARQTGRVGTGALVGLVAGLIGGIIVVIYGIIQITGNGPQITQALNQAVHTARQRGSSISLSTMHAIIVAGIVVGLIVSVAFQLGLGAGIGALGGLVGRRQAPPAPSAPYADNMWTPPPPPSA
jgi:hypothetical protein